MKCPKCGAENRYNALICGDCGASLLELYEQTVQDEQSGGFDSPHDDYSQRYAGIDDPTPPEDKGGIDWGENLAAGWTAFCAGAAKLGRWLWDGIKKIYQKLREWFMAAVDAVDGKVKEATHDDGSDEQRGETLRKIIIAVMLGVIILLVVIGMSVCGSCSGCSSCTSCGPETLTGTWADYNGTLDGYDAADVILELTDDGKVVAYGMEAGSYGYSDGQLTLVYNGMTYIAWPEPGDEYIDLYLNGSSFAGLRFIKLSDKTGLTDEKIAGLYPDE